MDKDSWAFLLAQHLELSFNPSQFPEKSRRAEESDSDYFRRIFMVEKRWFGDCELKLVAAMFHQPILIISGEGNDLFITDFYPTYTPDMSVERDKEAIVFRFSKKHYEPYAKKVQVKAILKSLLKKQLNGPLIT